jgi:signal transduction histidine kinase/CheY-like chemotaxis protein
MTTSNAVISGSNRASPRRLGLKAVETATWLPYVLTVALIAALVMSLGAFSAWQEKQSYRERASLAAQNMARLLDQEVSGIFDRVDVVLQTIAAQYHDELEQGRSDRTWLNAYLKRQESLLPEVMSLRIADQAGVMRYGNGVQANASVDLRDQDYFVRARDDNAIGLVVAGPLLSRPSQKSVLVLGRRITAPDGSFAGLVYAELATERFEKVLAAIPLGVRGTAIIRTADLALVHRYPDTRSAFGGTEVSPELVSLVRKDSDQGQFVARGTSDGIERSNAYRKLENYPFYVIVGFSTADFIGGWIDHVLMLFGLVTLVILVSGLASMRVYRANRRLAADVEAAKMAEQRQAHLLRALQLVSNCNLAIIRAPHEQVLLTDICRLVVNTGGYLMAWIGVAEYDSEKSVRPVAQFGPRDSYLARIRTSWDETKDIGCGPTGVAMRTGKIQVNQNILSNPKMAPWRDLATKYGCQSSIALPLVSKGEILAVLSVYSAEANAFVKEEIELLGDLASNVAYGMETLRVRALNAAARRELEEHHQKLEEQVAERTAELAAAKLEAERANNAKSRFLAAASHDLRQPLSALSLYVGTLGNKLPASEEHLLANMKNCVISLNDMLGNLLDLSKLDAGVVTKNVSDFSVDALIANVLSSQMPDAVSKGLTLRFGCFDVIGRTDPILFQRILENLVSNAIRYTDRGGVLVGCRRWQGSMWVEVWDTGIGIPADKTDVIFEEFRQLGNFERNRTKGTGLGLAIVAKTAALLGLRIRVRSKFGKGSVFAVELPLGERVESTIARHKYAHRPQRIALIEDNAEVATALSYALTAVGHEVVCAASVSEVLRLLAGTAPDIVVSDYRLTGDENGCDAIAVLREEFGRHLPALIITGDTDPAVIHSIVAAKISIQHKPLDLDALRSRIAELTG